MVRSFMPGSHPIFADMNAVRNFKAKYEVQPTFGQFVTHYTRHLTASIISKVLIYMSQVMQKLRRNLRQTKANNDSWERSRNE